MRNYTVKILDKNTKEELTVYTVEEETSTIARLRGIGKFRREFPKLDKLPILGKAEESKRTIIEIQEPKLWEYEIT